MVTMGPGRCTTSTRGAKERRGHIPPPPPRQRANHGGDPGTPEQRPQPVLPNVGHASRQQRRCWPSRATRTPRNAGGQPGRRRFRETDPGTRPGMLSSSDGARPSSSLLLHGRGCDQPSADVAAGPAWPRARSTTQGRN
jgi:hypothetical protein